uniref:Retrotransposon Copia-like N-terminal domain-containing protein n=1 Tax=Cajanus cajan TaxID=3821 RepID=A0A151U8Q9_CAJCA|nr:hypothetical protein KK1_019912 [Cajanus cajan]
MLTVLSAKNKVEFVDGSAREPSKTNKMYLAWCRCNNMVISWIVHSISTSIRKIILWIDKDGEVWRDLK